MKLYIIPLVLVLILTFSGCGDHDNEIENEDVFDLEWNKDMDIEKNTMFYIDNEGVECTIDIANTDISFFPSDGGHAITMRDVTDEQLEFHWRYEKGMDMEIKPGIVQLIPRFYPIYPEKNIGVDLSGMLNIIEVSNDEVIPGTEDDRKIDIKATFHIKKDFYYYQDLPGRYEKTKLIETRESKGIFYYSGIEERGPWLGDL